MTMWFLFLTLSIAGCLLVWAVVKRISRGSKFYLYATMWLIPLLYFPVTLFCAVITVGLDSDVVTAVVACICTVVPGTLLIRDLLVQPWRQ